MSKDILKEVIIVLLLTLAIILILAVLLYEYVPANKVIPEKVSYTTPENIKIELETNTDIDDTEVVITYDINSTELTNYKKIQEYVPGKKNPFSSLVDDTEKNQSSNSSTGANSSTNTGTNSSSTSNTTTDSNSTGYLPNKGTK